jgi:hypothetical protein
MHRHRRSFSKADWSQDRAQISHPQNGYDIVELFFFFFFFPALTLNQPGGAEPSTLGLMTAWQARQRNEREALGRIELEKSRVEGRGKQGLVAAAGAAGALLGGHGPWTAILPVRPSLAASELIGSRLSSCPDRKSVGCGGQGGRCRQEVRRQRRVLLLGCGVDGCGAAGLTLANLHHFDRDQTPKAMDPSSTAAGGQLPLLLESRTIDAASGI